MGVSRVSSGGHWLRRFRVRVRSAAFRYSVRVDYQPMSMASLAAFVADEGYLRAWGEGAEISQILRQAETATA